MKNTRALVISLVCGLIALLMIYFYIDEKEKHYEEAYELFPVLFAKRDIKRYEIVDRSMLKPDWVPKPFKEPDAFLNNELDRVLGSRADSFIPQGSQITLSRLSPRGASGLSVEIPVENRACTMAVNQVSGVAGLIRPYDHVDIVGLFKTVDEKTGRAKEMEALTLFQNIPVLSVGRNYTFDSPISGDPQKSLFSQKAAQGVGFSNITLSMTPRDCMDLVLAQNTGSLSLTLRSLKNRLGGEKDPDLKKKRSSVSSITGIKEPLQISPQPQWLELRGNQGIMVP